MFRNYIVYLLLVIFLSSCTSSQSNINKKYTSSNYSLFSSDTHSNINSLVSQISTDLLLNIPYKYQKNDNFVITTFVNLDDFKKTSKFARIVSESLIDELHKKRFKIIDFRTQEAISIDKNGEFILTRNINNIAQEIPPSLVIVGTYSKLDKHRIIINSRILNNFTSQVISTSKAIFYYKNCKYLQLCPKIKNENINIIKDTK